MSFEFDNNKPIYLQLVDIIKLKIISKELKPGSKLSSVRDMAQEFGVNPNTMQRALSELERENLLYSQRTSGRFVTDNEDNINQLREEVAKVEILSLYNILTKLGYKKEELIELVVYKSYSKKEVISNMNLNIPKGKIVGLLGPNGSGKSTLIKLINGLLQPNSGDVLIDGIKPSIETKRIVSYLPERTYLNDWMKVSDILNFFNDFYDDFDIDKAMDMVKSLNIDINEKLKTMSKGTKEKVQLILVMSRHAKLYILDEPIGGVDPAARTYILKTIITNYCEDSTLLIATHLISEIENICDDVIFISNGNIVLQGNVDEIREEKGKSIDALFREEFKC